MYGHNGAKRESTGRTDWKEAEALRAYITAGNKDEVVHGVRLGECVELYLKSRKHELSTVAYKQYERYLGRLRDYCEGRGIYFARELTAGLLERFKIEALAKVSDGTKRCAFDRVRAFLRDAFRLDWIEIDLANKVKRHATVTEQTEPYSDDDVERIMRGALSLDAQIKTGYSGHPETFQLLLQLMLETGMRAGDAIRYKPSACTEHESKRIWMYAYRPQKQRRTAIQKEEEAYIPAALKRAIDKCEWLSKDMPFYFGAGENTAYLCLWKCMQRIGRDCAVFDCRPHRFRDTFAVRKLLAGHPIGDVSKLLGHSSVTITERYYAKWVSSRRDRLRNLVAAESRANT